MQTTLQPVLILLATAVLVVVVCRTLRLPPLLGYLIVGAAIGPHALGWISNTEEVRDLAEIGVVFLMFSIGLEFSLPKLITMRRIVFGLGVAQVLATLVVVLAVAVVLGIKWQAGIVLGGALNCGGQRTGGSMTAPNPDGVRRCIRAALADASVPPQRIDAINGHLTATGADPRELGAWAAALECAPERFPAITATKSLIGHGLGAAGAIESVACVLMLQGGFLHPAINCDDVHPEIAPFAASIPHTVRAMPAMKTMIKAGFGFGDVNACAVFARWTD